MTYLTRFLFLVLATTCPLWAAGAAAITTLASITGNTDAATPGSELIVVGDELYGTAPAGGAFGRGAVFRVNPANGAVHLVYSFTGGSDGAAPGAALTLVGGSLYGTTTLGGSTGAGTLFRIDRASGAFSALYAFPTPPGTATNVFSALTLVGSKLYGTSFFGGPASVGSVFSFDLSTGAVSTVYGFAAIQNGGIYPTGAYPHGALVSVNGQLFGTTETGGPNGGGTVFSVDPAHGTETIVYGFGGANRAPISPMAGLLHVGNMLYGTTLYDYDTAYGTVFAIDLTTLAETTVASLTAANALQPEAPLVELGGLLYGTSFSQGPPYAYAQSGTVFSVDPQTGTATQVYAFNGSADGGQLTAGLVAFNGTLYGTASAGGGYSRETPVTASSGRGTVFAINPATGTETTLHDFVGMPGNYFISGGNNPALTGVGASLYGVSVQGGANGDGSVFRVDTTTGALTTLYSFTGHADGGAPLGSLTDVAGILYGATSYGTAFTGGSPFAYDRATRSLKSIIALPSNGSPTSGIPSTALTWVNGLFYGVTALGGEQQFGSGTFFSLDFATSQEAILHFFSDSGSDGAVPLAPLLNVSGVLYGTTVIGGTAACGTVFSYDIATGNFSTVYSFAGGSDGRGPGSALINVGGTLYGATDGDDLGTPGTIFSLDLATGVETALFGFPASGAEGKQARGLVAVGGLIYGTTAAGGAAGQGTVFVFRPSNRRFTTLYNFTGLADGGIPAGGLTEVAGRLYGITSQGGLQNAGTIFRVDP
jgi:uncharacterized repeat protein (TIGR03803 family)